MREQRTSQFLEEDIQKLKEWLIKQPHLPQDIDNETLSSFVYGTKSLEIAKQKLDSYCTVRSVHRKIFDFSVRDPLDPDFRKANSATRKFYLEGTTPEGYRVLFHRITPTFKECFVHSQEVIKSVMMVEMALQTWPDMTGLYLVYDIEGIDSSILPKLSPTFLASALEWVQGSLPVKMKGVLIINTPKFMEKAVDWLLKPFLKPKLFNRLKLTSEDKSCLKEYLPEDILPSDYDGKGNKSSEQLSEEWYALMVEKRYWFQKTSNQIVDEKMRPPDEKETYGVQGTFRKLAID